MGRRTNPLSLRVGQLINWPSNVSHPFLSQYLRHVFQGSLIAEPGIRSSLSHIWINVTVLGPVAGHPLVKRPLLELDHLKLSDSHGRLEHRLRNLTTGHHYFKHIFPHSKSLLEERSLRSAREGLGIFSSLPIHLHINVISNPLLNADILAQYTAKQLQERSLGALHKELLGNMG